MPQPMCNRYLYEVQLGLAPQDGCHEISEGGRFTAYFSKFPDLSTQ